jgi:hypothetical protein
VSLVRSVVCGALAGAVGSLAMDLVWFARYKRGGGESSFLVWEFGSAPTTWEDASAPAKVGKLLYESGTHRELPASEINLTTNVMHWGYAKQWGAIFGVAIGSRSHLKAWQAPLFGALVWLASYVSLPIAGFYKPIWSYDLKTLWNDLGPHLVYGVATAAAFWITSGE